MLQKNINLKIDKTKKTKENKTVEQEEFVQEQDNTVSLNAETLNLFEDLTYDLKRS